MHVSPAATLGPKGDESNFDSCHFRGGRAFSVCFGNVWAAESVRSATYKTDAASARAIGPTLADSRIPGELQLLSLNICFISSLRRRL